MKTLLTKNLLILLFLIPSCIHAQADDFNYSTAVALILREESGGHIFQRPDYDAPKNFFIIIYDIVGKYALQMQPQHSGLTLDISSLPVEEEMLVINHKATKLLFLGDHWIGDGERFAIVEDKDYQRLTGLFAETRKHRERPAPKGGLANYISDIHNIWAGDPEDFYREFYFPNASTLPGATASSPQTITPQTNIDSEIKTPDSHTQVREHEKPKAKQEDEPKQSEQQNSKVAAPVSRHYADKLATSTSSASKIMDSHSDEKAEDRKFAPSIWIVLTLGFSLLGYWLFKQAK
ncbi:MAG TPA: hypothetical protein VLC79_18110 [Cellvibrio sp.]|nr:hypothetical protein [Cellvibrio sp.]